MNKNFAIPAVFAGLLGLGMTSTALALPEVDVGSRPLVGTNMRVQSVAPADAAVAEESDTPAADDDTPSTSD